MKTKKSNYRLNWKLLTVILTLITLSACDNKGSNNEESNDKVEVPQIDILAATFLGDTRAVKQHVAAKSDLDIKDPYGSTALAIAATFGKTQVAKILIEGGANINLTNADGSTALHTAAFFGRTEIVEALLSKGVDSSIRNNFQVTARESISMPFEDVKLIYDQMAKDLGALGLKLDYDKIKEARPVIAEMIRKAE